MAAALTIIALYAGLTRWRLWQARRFQMQLAERIFKAHEVLANRAERKESKT